MNTVLKKPLISEKSTKLANLGYYTFLVGKSARKVEITKALENQFGVKALTVRTANFKKQEKQQRSRKGYYQIAGFKKAIVKLQKGQKIDLFESAKMTEGEVAEKEVKEKRSLTGRTKVRIEKGEKE